MDFIDVVNWVGVIIVGLLCIWWVAIAFVAGVNFLGIVVDKLRD